MGLATAMKILFELDETALECVCFWYACGILTDHLQPQRECGASDPSGGGRTHQYPSPFRRVVARYQCLPRDVAADQPGRV